MRPENQAARRREIENAAYELLAEKGYAATSMLAVAKRAGASNQTLYKWYGSKQVLFRSLVEENAREVADLLRTSLAAEDDPWETLGRLGPALLRLLTSENAIALNRGAAMDADDTGLLGQALAKVGRDTIMPLIAQVFERGRAGGHMTFENEEEAAEVYLGLLVGDLQVRRVIGVLAPLGDDALRRRAERALRFSRMVFDV